MTWLRPASLSRACRRAVAAAGLGLAGVALTAGAASADDGSTTSPLGSLTSTFGSTVGPVTDGLAPVTDGLGSITDGLSDLTDPLLAPVGELTGSLSPVLDPVGGVTGSLSPVLDPVTGVVGEVGGGVVEPVAGIAQPVVGGLEPVTGVLDPVLAPVTTPVLGTVGDVVDVTRPVTDPILEPLTPITAPVLETLEPVVDLTDDLGPVDDVVDVVEDVVVPGGGSGPGIQPPSQTIPDPRPGGQHPAPPVVDEPVDSSDPAQSPGSPAEPVAAPGTSEAPAAPEPQSGPGEAGTEGTTLDLAAARAVDETVVLPTSSEPVGFGVWADSSATAAVARLAADLGVADLGTAGSDAGSGSHPDRRVPADRGQGQVPTELPATSTASSSASGGSSARPALDGDAADLFAMTPSTAGIAVQHGDTSPPRDPYRDIPTSPA